MLLGQETAWQPVLNVAFTEISPEGARPLAPDTELGIITAIRKAEANDTHANVVSTPTRRIAKEQAVALIADKAEYCRTPADQTFELTEINPAAPQAIAEFDANFQPLLWLPDEPLPAITIELAESKMGMYSDLDGVAPEKYVHYLGPFGVSATRVLAGFSYVSDTPEGEPQYEPLLMVGSIASAGFMPFTFPRETSDYRNISLTPVESFAVNVKERNVGELVSATDWDMVYACVRGLCLATSVASTLSREEIWAHMGYAGDDLFRSYQNPAYPSAPPIHII